MNRSSGIIAAGCMALAMLPGACGKSEDESDPVAVSSSAPAAVLAEIAAWKSAGGVLDPRELKPKPPTAGARNAADLYESVAGSFVGISSADSELLNNAWEAPSRSLEYLLESFERELPIIHEAAALPYCDWGTSVEQGDEANVEYLRQVRSIARLLAVEALVRADGGDFDGAAASIVDIMRLGDQAASESHSMGVLMRNALDALAMEALERMFKDAPSVPSVVSEALADRAYATYVRRALIHEGSLAVAAVRAAAGGNVDGPIEQQAIPQHLADGLVWYLSTMRSSIDELNQPYFQRSSAVQREPMPSSARLPDGLATFEDIDRICRVGASIENNCAVARLAIALRAHHQAHGEYPDPQGYAVALDALTGQPIEYQRTSDGFRLRASIAGLRGETADCEWEW